MPHFIKYALLGLQIWGLLPSLLPRISLVQSLSGSQAWLLGEHWVEGHMLGLEHFCATCDIHSDAQRRGQMEWAVRGQGQKLTGADTAVWVSGSWWELCAVQGHLGVQKGRSRSVALQRLFGQRPFPSQTGFKCFWGPPAYWLRPLRVWIHNKH